MDTKIIQIKNKLNSLAIYRSLLDDEIVGKFLALLGTASDENSPADIFSSQYGALYHALTGGENTLSLKDYILSKMIFSDNIFSSMCENLPPYEINGKLAVAAGREIGYLSEAASLTSSELKNAVLSRPIPEFQREIISGLPDWNALSTTSSCIDIAEKLKASASSDAAGILAGFHRENGRGDFARYQGFVWEDSSGGYGLKGVSSTDPIRLSDLKGYELERQKVVENTLHLLDGYPANNILLYGDSGTGKSSTVKAILNEYSHRGLRMIELPAARVVDFPHILREIAGHRNKFIIFIDDLAFEDSESQYTALKALLEGSLESRPQNVVIYATSNRRHLIKERLSDRAGMFYGSESDEIHARDAIQEKNSLSERFGITVTFTSPDKEKYLMIVENIAQQRGLIIDKSTLDKEALIWEAWQNGRSPRTARQFVDWLEGKLGGSITR